MSEYDDALRRLFQCGRCGAIVESVEGREPHKCDKPAIYFAEVASVDGPRVRLRHK